MSFVLKMQQNYHERDYLYEISTLYLTARCFHLAMSISLPTLIPDSGITYSGLFLRLRNYNEEAIKQLIEFLALFQFVRIENNIIFNTEYSKSAIELFDDLKIEESEWNQSYYILNYFQNHPEIINRFSKELTILIESNSICYQANIPEDTLMEIYHGHLISRSIRFFTTSGLVNFFVKHESITLEDLLQESKNIEGMQDINELNLSILMKLLDRYKIVNYDQHSKLIQQGSYLPYLLESHPESISKAMYMITEPWWNAAGKMENSFLKNELSSFESVNGKSFYDVYISSEDRNTFMEGMAAISLLENHDVCQALVNNLQSFETIIDIGGGDGTLLKLIQEKFPNKKYILFEKLPNCADSSKAEAELKQQIQKKHGENFDVTIVLGDFAGDITTHNLPILDNVAYIMKCVLHNLRDPAEIRYILNNIHQCLGGNSRFFLAERIVLADITRPHLNVQGNILMRLLFKAEARTLSFYEEILESAGFNSADPNKKIISANNYLIFTLSTENYAL